MKNLSKKLLFVASLFGLLTITGCGESSTTSSNEFDSSKLITRYTRDTESGTRDGFFTAIGFKDAVTKNEVIPNCVEATDNGNMISLVNNDEYGIGYISLASLESSSLTGLSYNGVAPSEESVVDGTYGLSRNFNYITRLESDCTPTEWTLIRGFLLFMNSKEGLTIIKSKDGILTKSIASSTSFNDLLNLEENKDVKDLCAKACEDNNKTEIKFGGSTSVEKISKALTEAFATYCPSFKPTHNHTGSGTAFKGTQGSEKDGVNSMHMGFLSRELSSSETALEGSHGLICKDGIVVVVNAKNNLVSNLTTEQVKTIYSQDTTKWSDIIAK